MVSFQFKGRFLVFLFLLAFTQCQASSQDFYVNPDTGSNGNDGLAPDRAWKTITFALTQVPAGATLNLASGVYDATGGEVFRLYPTAPISIVGAGTGETIIRGTAGQVVIWFENLGGTSKVRDLTITGGIDGIFVVNAPVSVESVELTSNEHVGIVLLNQGDLAANLCDIHDNGHSGITCIQSKANVIGSRLSRNGERGVVATMPSSSVSVRDCLIAANGQSGRSNGIGCHEGAEIEVVNSTVILTNGPGIGIGSGTVSLDHCLLSGNEIGIDCIVAGKVNVSRSGICGNLGDGIIINSTVDGSSVNYNLIVGNRQQGIVHGFSTLDSIYGNTIVRNGRDGILHRFAASSRTNGNILAANGFYGLNEGDGNSDPSVRNNLFFGNSLGNYLDEGTIPYNTEFEINNLVGNGTAVVENNIVADPLFVGGPSGINTAIEYDEEDFQSILTDSSASWQPNKFTGAILYPHIGENTFAYYIVENDATTVRVWGDITDASFAGTPIGATYEIVDYHLSRFSPAIDAGYDPAVEEGDTDLDGNSRIAGEGVDIGAFEFGSCPVCPSPTITPTQTNSPTATETHTPSSTSTPIPTFTPLPTHTPFPTWTPPADRVPGDLTGDGEVNVEDLLEVLRWWKR